MYFNPAVTGSVFIFFSLIGTLYFLLIKNKLSEWAFTTLDNRKKKYSL